MSSTSPSAPRFPGVIPAVMTPFDEDLGVRPDVLAANVDWLVEAGVGGIVSTGTMGEAYSLTDAERELVTETVLSAVAGRVPVIAGISSDTPGRAAALAASAERAGAQGVMCTPATYAADEPELHDFYATVGDASGLPVIVYNNPSVTHTDLRPDQIIRLAAIANVVAVKETSGDSRRIFEILEAGGGEVEVLVGGDDWALEGAAAGATGWISGCAVAVPELSIEMFAAAATAELERARAVYRRLAPLARLDMDPKLVQFFKGALDHVGRYGGPVRPPRRPLPRADADRLRAALDVLDGVVAPARVPADTLIGGVGAER